MSSSPPHDPRAFANLLLDLAEEQDLELSNLALQKILYFSYAKFLFRYNQPLVTGYFEAWEYGPVHPAVYRAFRESGKTPISFRAQKHDYVTNTAIPLAPIQDRKAERVAAEVIDTLGHWDPSKLVRLSHARDGPWHSVKERAKREVALGLRISDDDTRAHFKHLKLPLRILDEASYPDEDTPLTAHRSSPSGSRRS